MTGRLANVAGSYVWRLGVAAWQDLPDVDRRITEQAAVHAFVMGYHLGYKQAEEDLY